VADAFTIEQTVDRLNAYEQWARLAREGRELFEGPDSASAKPMTAPGPIESLKNCPAEHYSVQQIYDAYRICAALSSLVRRGNHLFSKSPHETALRPEKQLELSLSKLG
jgi:hypothetical protein